jgi:hypothetical protein
MDFHYTDVMEDEMRLLTACVALMAVGCGTPEVEGPTFHADVRPLLDQHCVRCHQEDGLGVGDWTDHQIVDAFAELIADRIETGEMPPPVSEPECREYLGSDSLSVPQESRDIVSRWIEAGRPMGDPADDPGVVVEDVDLVDPDITLMIPRAYTPSFTDPENPGNEYRCFMVDPGSEEVFVTGMDPVIGTDELVHHVVLNTLDREDIDDVMLGDDGWDCIDDMDGNNMLAGWAPGALPVEFPDGYTMTMGGDQVLIVQMHYYQASPEDSGKSDLSGYAFTTSEEPGRPLYLIPLGDFSFNIPAGDEAYTSGGRVRHRDLGIPVGIEIHSIFPHMHRLGTGYSASIEHADGTETCLVNGRYEFDNQLTYQFNDRPMFDDGDSVNFSCEWNNSTSNENQVGEPKDTRYGERTDEEMCFFFTLVSPGAP